MRCLLFAFLGALAFSSASAQGLSGFQESYDKYEKQLREVRARLAESPSSLTPEDRERMKTELNELQEVFERLSGHIAVLVRENADRYGELRSSPQYRFNQALDDNKRVPTAKDISGIWTSGQQVGFTLLLEQKGATVTGQGCHWGCMGLYSVFQVTGSRKGGTLSLTFIEQGKEPVQHDYRSNPARGGLRFVSAKGDGRAPLVPE